MNDLIRVYKMELVGVLLDWLDGAWFLLVAGVLVGVLLDWLMTY